MWNQVDHSVGDRRVGPGRDRLSVKMEDSVHFYEPLQRESCGFEEHYLISF
jgi:hypothetical protein